MNKVLLTVTFGLLFLLIIVCVPESHAQSITPLTDSPGKTIGSDFNGDGIHDFIIGADKNDDGTGNDAGAAYIFFGASNISGTKTAGTDQDVEIFGKADTDRLGIGVAECNRLPFDLPEDEASLVAGYHTEYGSMKFAIFFMAEYFHVMAVSALITTLFFGGWQLIPGMLPLAELAGIETYAESLGLSLLHIASFGIKTTLMILFFIWIRWTFPRFRYDQLMSLGWKIMVPLALANILITSILVYLRIL